MSYIKISVFFVCSANYDEVVLSDYKFVENVIQFDEKFNWEIWALIKGDFRRNTELHFKATLLVCLQFINLILIKPTTISYIMPKEVCLIKVIVTENINAKSENL